MNDRDTLYVLFTMDCLPAVRKATEGGPKTWEISARSIESFCTQLHAAGYPVTLFASPDCAEEHSPLLEELTDALDAELGLYVSPKLATDGQYKRYLGAYGEEEQREIVKIAMDRFMDAMERRPQSFRSAEFSASDDTFGVLYSLGFQQGSVSAPGRQVAKYQAVWVGAPTTPHYPSRDDRLQEGDLPFLEVPVTTDPDRVVGGVSAELCVDTGKFETWHRQIIERHLESLEAQDTAFKLLCLFTRNGSAYHQRSAQPAENLARILDHLESLRESYEIAPVTLFDAHQHYMRRRDDAPSGA